MKKGKIGAVILSIILIFCLVGTLMCTEKIPAGYIGVVYSMNGGVDGEILTQGFHIVAPTKHVTEYSIAIEQGYLSRDKQEGSENDNSFDIPTSDGKTINVDLEYSYHFDADKITDTFVRFKGQSGDIIEETFIRGKLKAWASEISSTFTVIDVFGDKRTELNNSVKDHVAKNFMNYGVIIDTINFTRIETDAETQAAIQKKVNAQQELELAQIEAKTAMVQAEKDKEVALIQAQQEKEKSSIQAEQAKIKAEGDAQARTIQATAEANANRMVAESLTPELLNKIRYDKWDGSVPQVQGNATPIISIE